MDKANRATTLAGKVCYMLLMLLFTLPTLAIASTDEQTEISGVVTDDKTGDPLIGVTISVVRNGKVDNGVITDFDGLFAMPTPTGNYEVHISYMGYQTVVLKPGRDKM